MNKMNEMNEMNEMCIVVVDMGMPLEMVEKYIESCCNGGQRCPSA